MTDLTPHRATGDAHKIIQKYLPGSPNTIEIGSAATTDGSGRTLVRTEIHWRGPVTADHVQMGAAIVNLPGYVRAENDDHHIVFWRNA